MKMSELFEEVLHDIEKDDKEAAKAVIKERLIEIRNMKKILSKAESKLQDLLNKDIEDVI